ncbi:MULTISPECIES: putative bifunctional diguanylate cyclase/phosphodiesterase [Legionella]|uniref:Bifunctional diguanylate cyclase/phosphodiesterase n=1 Tax=Legionella resiliens TaxID=2905958 RepID=A0ABS8WZV4_9GAMM|nr:MULTISPECIES: bifunctional diguanylate cyclase/phosphodiesterase [unclassified Legionella]MCE0722875.1 bifunctional diguanylate cyclase/phosphodiesterase [Legionella sp. 9fVS26]MCE3532028.1 bifunctional diguanylate cyclase/phosphodiesterase [Legionella sp. 8cVS16]QLZ68146.1 bifunctional diguanylate cyclase/phosphodiesterase [Legionella sp. PC1000]
MDINHRLAKSSIVFKEYVNKYAYIGLSISICSIFIASLIVSYQITGFINLSGFVKAQTTNPAIWVLDLSPFLFAYWGQSFCHGLANTAESLVADKTKELLYKSGDLESKLKYESEHDYFTQLPNALLFSEQIRQAIDKIEKPNELAVIILKLNDFKTVHNNFGNFNANSALIQFVKKLKDMLLNPFMLQATMGINSIARIEGDEFALLLPRLNKNINFNALLEAIIGATTLNFIVDGIQVHISTTAGAAIYPQAGENDVSLVSHARTAVFHARKKSKPFAIYNSNMEDDFTSNRIVMNSLKKSIENQEIKIYYQPTVELATGKIIGAEAKVRFVHEKYGLISAEKFNPLIEGSSLIQQLSSFLLIDVIKQLVLWHQEGHKIFASVNLSVQDVIDVKLPDFVEKLLNKNKIAPEYLILEFNERACLSDQEKSTEVLNQLSELGVKISIDDFCSGYSSFTYLVNFPINEVKIEKSLVLNMIKDKKKSKIVEAIIKLAQTLELNVLADGIENQEIREQLQQYGCRYGQGFYFSRQVSPYEFMALLNSEVTG